jgi:methionyl-tRNA formyltransferase
VLAVDADGMHVVCGDGVVRILEIQASGRKRMSARAFATGNDVEPGARLGAG